MSGEFRMKHYKVKAELVSVQTFTTPQAANEYMALRIEHGFKVGCQEVKNLTTSYRVEVYKI